MLTNKQLREHAHYDIDTGVFTRLKNGHGLRSRVGEVMGWDRGAGYLKTTINGAAYSLHRLAWLYVYGEWPDGMVDHIDGNPSNNSINNLRVVCRNLNAQNQRKAHKTNICGVLGVSKRGDRFRARIYVNGRKVNLGTFATPDEAHQAYVDGKRRLHPGCAL